MMWTIAALLALVGFLLLRTRYRSKESERSKQHEKVKLESSEVQTEGDSSNLVEDQEPFPAIIPDILLHIFSFLERDILCTCAMVCKEWRILAYTPFLWRDYVPKICMMPKLNNFQAQSFGMRNLQAVYLCFIEANENGCFRGNGKLQLNFLENILSHHHRIKALIIGEVTLDSWLIKLLPTQWSSLRRLAIYPNVRISRHVYFNNDTNGDNNLSGQVAEEAPDPTDGLTKDGLQALLKPLVNLEQLDLSYDGICFVDLNYYQYLAWEGLIDKQHVEYDCLQIIFSCLPKLRDLEFKRPYSITDLDKIAQAVKLPRLERLVISVTPILSDCPLEAIARHFPTLQHLSLRVSFCSRGFEFINPDWHFPDCVKLCHLQSLKMRTFYTDPENWVLINWNTLANFAPSLVAIDLGSEYSRAEDSGFTDVDIHSLTALMPNLSVLNLAGHTRITISGFTQIAASLEHLEVLILPDTPYCTGLDQFLELTKLKLPKLTSLLGIHDLECESSDKTNVKYITLPDWNVLKQAPNTKRGWFTVKPWSADWLLAFGTQFFFPQGSYFFDVDQYVHHCHQTI